MVIIGLLIPFICLLKNKIQDKIYVAKVNDKVNNNKSYFAVLDIPDINLKRELYSINDINNHVDKNILIHKSSVFPKNGKSNVILAGHSGNGSNAYFKNLYKLDIGDVIKLHYNGFIYEYEIMEIEYQIKSGNLYLKQDFDNMITLLTCTYRNNKTQTIYYGNMIKVLKI